MTQRVLFVLNFGYQRKRHLPNFVDQKTLTVCFLFVAITCTFSLPSLPHLFNSWVAFAANMAGQLVGGALLSAFLQVAFDRLASPAVLEYFRGRRLNEKLLDKLNVSLLSINAVIDDAEEKHISNRHVRAWLDKVKDAVLDAEDLLDEIDTEASKTKLEAEYQTSTSKVWNYFSASVSSFDKELESRMKEILDNLEFLASKKEILGLKEGGSGVGVGLGKKISQRLPTTSLVDEAVVYGRDDDKNVIVDLLLSDNESGNNLSVISIVGMGGMGKTTLAQLVYNDHKVEVEFDLKAWVCVSEEFDVFRVTRTILEAITLSSDDTKDINMLQVKLKEKLAAKKFLLVLDDIWNENYLNWEALKTPFVYGARGSKILVTTRSDKVASTMRCANIHQLKHLPEEDSWLLFAKHALSDGDPQSNTGFEEIGRKIIKKCKGLPLALKTIGSLLYTKLSPEEWNGILTSEIWELSDEESNIIAALRLSYQHLPCHLKRCFAYCSLLPKDYEFDKEYLIQLWMAEDFLQFHKKQNKSMKELGDQFFNDLLSRSFFQQLSGDRMRFVMHDLVSDLAKYVSGEFCLRLEVEEEAKDVSKLTRHFSYVRNFREASQRLVGIHKASKLRTFLPLFMHSSEAYSLTYLSSKIIHELISIFKCLRVLSLAGYINLFELPDSIGNLTHLRYLDLSFTGVKKLPESTCFLYNLQTLKLRNCRSLEELPSNMHKLVNLRHLDFRRTRVKKVPIRFRGALKNLEVLSSFYVGKCVESNINQLAELNLGGTLSILELQNVLHPMDALAANLKKKKHLEGLLLNWSKNNDGSQNERDVLEKLQPHTNLKELSIENYSGTRFPDWFGDNSLSNIVSLELSCCTYCFFLPPLGMLPSLKTLSITGLDGIEVIGPEFYGDYSSTVPFGSLEVLKIQEMAGWEKWECENASGAFPCLKELYIRNCPKLKKQLPQQLPSLLKLVIMECGQLVTFLPWVPTIHELVLENCGNLQWESLASTLKMLHIHGRCLERSLLEKIEYMIANTCLESLKVSDCPNMEFPICHSYDLLQILVIERSCDSLRTLPLDFFPKLQSLDLNGCSNLERFSISEGHDLNLTYLTTLEIWGCPKFVSFPIEGLSAPKLEWCRIAHLESLKSLPKGMHILFPSLRHLTLIECPQLESFHDGDLPPNIKELEIYNCPKVMASRMEWDLHSHNSLNYFHITDANVESLPDQQLLPPTLSSLSFSECSNLKTLNYKGLCHLSCVKLLSIKDCPRLQCLPKEGLPNSLFTLEIRGNCPLLKQRCQQQKGEDWSKIAHIPCIKIDDDIIT